MALSFIILADFDASRMHTHLEKPGTRLCSLLEAGLGHKIFQVALCHLNKGRNQYLAPSPHFLLYFFNRRRHTRDRCKHEKKDMIPAHVSRPSDRGLSQGLQAPCQTACDREAMPRGHRHPSAAQPRHPETHQQKPLCNCCYQQLKMAGCDSLPAYYCHGIEQAPSHQ